MPEENTYRPVNCSFYDLLEAWATLKTTVAIVYLAHNNTHCTEQGVIADLLIKNKAEYLVLQSGTHIRLDRLISVNGINLPDNACAV